MRLDQYLDRIQNILYSRQEIIIEHLQITETVPDQKGLVYARLRFWDNSLLEFTESLVEHGVMLTKSNYAYHYQDANNKLIFRYDNAPHHSEISTHPHHKHTRGKVEAAEPPHLNDVLREIDQLLYRLKESPE